MTTPGNPGNPNNKNTPDPQAGLLKSGQTLADRSRHLAEMRGKLPAPPQVKRDEDQHRRDILKTTALHEHLQSIPLVGNLAVEHALLPQRPHTDELRGLLGIAEGYEGKVDRMKDRFKTEFGGKKWEDIEPKDKAKFVAKVAVQAAGRAAALRPNNSKRVNGKRTAGNLKIAGYMAGQLPRMAARTVDEKIGYTKFVEKHEKKKSLQTIRSIGRFILRSPGMIRYLAAPWKGTKEINYQMHKERGEMSRKRQLGAVVLTAFALYGLNKAGLDDHAAAAVDWVKKLTEYKATFGAFK